ncbi:MAG: hypothetical protein ACFFD5_13550 [Candidatus Thorarchaeota archaeon]
MKKKLKKKETSRKNFEKEEGNIQIKNPQLDTISEIMEFKIKAENSLLNGNFDEAISYSEKVIRLAIKNNMDHHIEEQKDFMKKIAERVQKKYFISEIEEAGAKINKIYDILIESNKINQAHTILESFTNHYKDKFDLQSIPLIENLIKKDVREWIKYKISINEKYKEKDKK